MEASTSGRRDVLGMDLVDGEPSELFGFEEFSVENTLEHLEGYEINFGYPQLARLIVFAAR